MTPQLKSKRPSQKLSKLTTIDPSYEFTLRAQGYRWVVGVDEAGRGPLAGPVVAAACLIDEGICFEGINDSKQLTPAQRENLFAAILERAAYGVGIVSHQWIDEINILQATHRAMRLAVQNLPISPDFILVDGRDVDFEGTPSRGIIGGDGKCASIAAASILAKVVRDRIMHNYHQLYPAYGYDKHKGYGTEQHRLLLKELGPSPIQRLSFCTIR